MEENEENLLGGLLYDMDEIKQRLDYLKLPWMKLANVFFQGYIDSPLRHGWSIMLPRSMKLRNCNPPVR